jgi:hypothetical protein
LIGGSLEIASNVKAMKEMGALRIVIAMSSTVCLVMFFYGFHVMTVEVAAIIPLFTERPILPVARKCWTSGKEQSEDYKELHLVKLYYTINFFY